MFLVVPTIATRALLAAHGPGSGRATVEAALCYSCAEGKASQGKCSFACSWIIRRCWLRYFQVRRRKASVTDVHSEHAAIAFLDPTASAVDVPSMDGDPNQCSIDYFHAVPRLARSRPAASTLSAPASALQSRKNAMAAWRQGLVSQQSTALILGLESLTVTTVESSRSYFSIFPTKTSRHVATFPCGKHRTRKAYLNTGIGNRFVQPGHENPCAPQMD